MVSDASEWTALALLMEASGGEFEAIIKAWHLVGLLVHDYRSTPDGVDDSRMPASLR